MLQNVRKLRKTMVKDISHQIPSKNWPRPSKIAIFADFGYTFTSFTILSAALPVSSVARNIQKNILLRLKCDVYTF